MNLSDWGSSFKFLWNLGPAPQNIPTGVSDVEGKMHLEE